MSERALYYPYIHIRDVNWLKATLLLFSQVRRMVPELFTPLDDPAVSEFAQHFNKQGEYLLRAAAVWEERAVQAQQWLADKLRRDGQDPAFIERFGVQSAWSTFVADDPFGFQVHVRKLTPELQETLRTTWLIWDPITREPYDWDAEYVAMHPSVGEVVMSILAIACAEHEGLDIVGDRRSGNLHAALIAKDHEAIYNAWLHPPTWPEPPQQPTGENLFEFLLGFYCDLGQLTPKSLASMNEDREPLKRLVARLRKIAADIPAMDPGPEQLEYFKNTAADVLREWRAERANMSRFWRVFFGEGVAEPGIEFGKKAVDKALEIGGPTGIGTLVGGLVGAGAGLAIGILAHAGKSYFRMRTEEKRSAYRYLTLLEQTGVVFRGDLGARIPDKGLGDEGQDNLANAI